MEGLPDNGELGPNPVSGIINASVEARTTIELYISIAVGAGYALAAEDAMAAIERAGDQAAERN